MKIDTLINEADREIRMRERLYSRLTKEGRMTESAAQHGLDTMGEIRAVLLMVKRIDPNMAERDEWASMQKESGFDDLPGGAA